MTLKALKYNKRYFLHHTATAKGHRTSDDPERVEPYKGRFGEGYIVYLPTYSNSRFCTIAYYIRKPKGAESC